MIIGIGFEGTKFNPKCAPPIMLNHKLEIYDILSWTKKCCGWGKLPPLIICSLPLILRYAQTYISRREQKNSFQIIRNDCKFSIKSFCPSGL